MLDIREIAKLYTSKPNQQHYYDRVNNSFISFSDSQKEKERKIDFKRYVPLNRYSLDYLRRIAESFIVINSADFLYFEYNEIVSLNKFEKYIRSTFLYDKWIDYLLIQIAYDMFSWTKKYALDEIETDNKTYSKIRKYIDKLFEIDYENYFSSKQLFYSANNYLGFYFTLLNFGGTDRGVNIFPSDNGKEIYKQFVSEEVSDGDRDTIISLLEFISIYYDEDSDFRDSLMYNIPNPIDDKYHISIVLSYPGIQYHNYLPKSVGIFLLNTLKQMIDTVKRTIRDYKDKVDMNSFQEINDVHGEVIYPQPIKIDNLTTKDMIPDKPFYDMSEDNYTKIVGYPLLDETWSFTFRRCTTYFIESKDSRILFSSYIAVFSSEDEDQIIDMIITPEAEGRPVGNLSKVIAERLMDKGIAKNILVNNLLDYYIFDCLFSIDIDKGDITITPTPDKLNSDHHFTSLKDEMDDEEDENKREDA